MDLCFRLVAILLLFGAASHCFPNAPCRLGPWMEQDIRPWLGPDSSTPNTPVYDVTTSPLHYNTTSKTSTSSTFDKSSEIRSSATKELSLLDFVTLTNGSQRTISELKCGEYAEEVANVTETEMETLDNINESGQPITLLNYCKLMKLGKPADIAPVGGIKASVGEYPHMVALGKYISDGSFILVCGGTLISHTWVLSAAHCTHGANGAPTHARMGIDRLADPLSGITKRIENIVRHPDYNPPALYADVALMKLQTSVTFSLTIYPACLYQQYNLPPFKEEVLITGWGVTEIYGEQSDYLQKLHLPPVNDSVCRVQHKPSKEIPYGITSSMICAGGDENMDACHGDSGGPLQIYENMCIPHVVGIISFGRSCGFKDLSGVYIRVSNYTSWIEKIVWPQRK